MKNNYNFNVFLGALVCVVSGFWTGQINAQTYFTAPYSTGFENGIDPCWGLTSSQTTGEITTFLSGSLVWSTQTALSHSGSYFMGMHNANPGGTYNLNQADLHLDLGGSSNHRLRFWWAEWNDETEIEDGLYISDDGGLTFTKVLDLNGASYTDLVYTFFDLNLDSINTIHSLSFTSTYIIRFQQYDNFYFAGGNDGFLIDDLEVTHNCNTGGYIEDVVCTGTYTLASGATVTASGYYFDTLANAAGCDSIHTYGLTVSSPTSETIAPSGCATYTAPDGAVYTTSGTYTAVIPNFAGCDSTITINLTIVNATSSTISPMACDTFVAPDGATYTSSGTYSATIPNAAGCDSSITINLTVNQNTSSISSATGCHSYTWTNGVTYYSGGFYTQTLTNSVGCDSVATLALLILTGPPMTISPITSIDLQAIGNAVSYEWIDCNTMAVVGTGATFTATVNGDYAVIGTDAQGCSDTSACYSVTEVGIPEFNPENVSIFPNPVKDVITIETHYRLSEVEIYDAAGKLVRQSTANKVDVSSLPSGIYQILVRFENDGVVRQKFVKQ